MLEFDIRDFVPQFLLDDKNGFALAKAIEAMLKYTITVTELGFYNVMDAKKMPEWRLDEMAWEYGVLYDYTADIEKKRHWISDAVPLTAALGTPQSIYNYLEGYFDSIEVEEFWQYGGEPFHFRVTAVGEWNDYNEAWLRKAVEACKNVRSVMDGVAVGSGTTVRVKGEGGVIGSFWPRMTGEDIFAGTYPDISMIGRIAEAKTVVEASEAKGHKFPYILTGMQPDTATVVAIADGSVKVTSEGTAAYFVCAPTSETKLCGTDL